MIIFSVILWTILLFVFMVSVNKTALRYLLSGLSAILLVASIFLMVQNDRDHFGMHKVTTTKTQQLVSVSPSKQMSMLLYQTVGTSGKEKVYIYKTDKNQKKPKTTNPDPTTTSNKVVKVNGESKLITKTTRWEYRSGTYKFWFGISGNAHKLVKRSHTFKVNKNWLVLSSAQAKKLQKLAKANQAKMKTEAKTYVTAQVKKAVTAAMTKNPSLSAAEQAKITKQATEQATAAFQKQSLEKMLSQIK